MPESEKRTPISVCLTPRATMILRHYNENSGYSSLSRTVEEIILAFDTTYKSVKDAIKVLTKQFEGRSDITKDERMALTAILLANLNNKNSTISRLESATAKGHGVNL